jgi:capping protein alpha
VKLPGGSSEVLVSEHNSLGDGRYYDVESQTSFAFDHATQRASGVQSYVLEGEHVDLVYVKEYRFQYRIISFGTEATGTSMS